MRALLLSLGFALLSAALPDMNLPTLNLTAGSSVQITNLTRVPDSKLAATRVYLQSSVTYYSFCVLIPELPVNTTTFNLTIPAAAGPQGSYYRIATANFYNLTTREVGLPVPFYSSQFFLSNPSAPGPSREWTEWEIHSRGAAVVGVDLPCQSYDCVRACIRIGPAPVTDGGGGGWTDFGGVTYDARYLACVNRCPGVDFDAGKLDNRPGYVSVTTGTGQAASTVESSRSGCPTVGAGRFDTPCGSECCSAGELCYLWNQCAAADEGEVGASTTAAFGGGFPGNTGLPTATAAAAAAAAATTSSAMTSASGSASTSSAQPTGNGAESGRGGGIVALAAGLTACMTMALIEQNVV